MTQEEKKKQKLEKICQEWNSKYPAGTVVEYHPIIDEPGFNLYRTEGLSYVLSGHTAVVRLIGKAGCVALDACKPIDSV
jgi:hypothetical protein